MAAVEALDSPDDAAVSKVVKSIAEPPALIAQEPFNGWIESFGVQGVRAFGPLETIQLSRGLTIIYAQNGSGKTSLVDAIELLSDGRTTRAAQYPQLEGEMKDEHHVQHATLNGSPCSPIAKVNAVWRPAKGMEAVDSVWAATWGQAAEMAPPVHLLARRRLREVIALKGPDRASRLGDALGLSALTAEWSGAQNLLAEQAKRLEVAPIVPQEFVEEVARLVASTASDADESFIRDQITQEALLVLSAEPVDELLPASPWDATLAQPISIPPTLPQIASLVESIQGIEDLAAQPQPVAGGGIAPELMELLRAFLSSAKPHEICPACEDGTVRPERLTEIERILQDLAALEQHLSMQKAVQSRAAASMDALSLGGLDWQLSVVPAEISQALGASETDSKFRASYTELQKKSVEWNAEIQAIAGAKEKAGRTMIVEDLRSLAVSLTDLGVRRQTLEAMSMQCEELRTQARQERIATAKRPAALEADWRILNAQLIAGKVVETRRAKKRQAVMKRASAALKTHLDSTVGERCGLLAEPINEWMARLAPDKTPGVRVATRGTSGRTSLDLFVAGGGQVKAIGRLSDSQLDMLGLAAHLATLEREAPGQPVIIDDPTDMLDHLTRDKLAGEGIARLLEGHDGVRRQVVVLTHDDQFVRELWRHHGHRWPTTSQLVIEVNNSVVPPQAVVVPRSATQYLERVETLLSEHPDDGNRLWLRSAAGNQLRQALEMIVKDIHVVVGPLGLGYSKSGEDSLDKRGVGAAFDDVARVIKDIERVHSECGSARHRSARTPIARLLDSIDRRKDYLLDEASHADFVYPSVVQIKQYASQLKWLAQFLEPNAWGRTDEWPASCRWAKELQTCPQCLLVETAARAVSVSA
ncbi:hypothetical protein StoSoilB20_18730 [Arthrobacter sp. StoSoilB20]|nr:hypothetical protein StoSoilB20_18730 [Arthrobacter sp. StoSoilB20]